MLTALVSLQFDRLSTAKISPASAIEYALGDAIDDIDDDMPRIAGGKAIAFISGDFPGLRAQARASLSGSTKAARPNAPSSRHARGPPVNA